MADEFRPGSPVRIRTLKQLRALAKYLGVRDDWHEPDEQAVTAMVFGSSFDNAGHWGLEHLGRAYARNRTHLHDDGEGWGLQVMPDSCEMFVVLYKDGMAVAEVDLATLFAFACGTYKGE